MKRLAPILLIFFIIMGLSFLIMVLRMVWFPPSSMRMMMGRMVWFPLNSMGMVMGRNMILHHMFFMFSQIFSISLIIVGLFILIWMLIKSNKKS